MAGESEEEKVNIVMNEGDGEEGAAEDSGGNKKKKIIIIAAAAVAVIVITIAGLFFAGVFSSDDTSEQVQSEEVEEESDEEAGAPVFFELGEILVNLNTGSKQASFLKMIVSLELPSQLQIPEIEAKMPLILDSFQVYLRELRVDDLQGSAAIFRLREELLLRVNKVVYPTKVNDILFKEILVQ